MNSLSWPPRGIFFSSGSGKLSNDGTDLVKVLAKELGKLPNHIALEGHTDSQPYSPGGGSRERRAAPHAGKRNSR